MPTGLCCRLERISVWCFRYLPLQAKTRLPNEMHNAPSSFRLFARAKQQHANAKRSLPLPLPPPLRNFTTFLSATSNSALTLGPPAPALSCAVHFARSSELVVACTTSYLLCLRLFTPSPLRFLLTPGEHTFSPHHAGHLSR